MISRSETEDGSLKWEFINDKTGKCEFTLVIPIKELEAAAKVMVRIQMEELEIVKQNTILYNIPEYIRNNIQKISVSFDKLTKEYYDHVQPMLNSIVSMANLEAEISSNCDSFWKAVMSKESDEIGAKYWLVAQDKFDELRKIKAAYPAIAYDMTSQVELLQKRLQQFVDQLSKIDQTAAPEGYKLYKKLYDTTKAQVDMCVRYQAQIPSWKKIEGDLLAKAKEKFNLIKEMEAKLPKPKAGNGAEESKEGEVQPLSPTRISTSSNSESKENSPNDSPSHSPNNSPGSSPSRNANSQSQIKNDSPLYAAYSDNAKLSSSPLAMYGNNSQAVQQQKQKLATQYQQSSAANLGQGYRASN